MIWTQEENNIIKENFGKKTLNQIMELIPSHKIGYSGFRSHCQRIGLFRPKDSIKLPNKNTYNQEYFKDLTFITSFLAGRIAADGCILLKANKSYHFSYKVAIKDENIIDEFIKEFNYIGPKQYSQCKSPHSDNISKLVNITLSGFDTNAYYLNLYYNLGPNKTKRLGPTNLKDRNLNWSFIIGMWDGDGTIAPKRTIDKKNNHVYDIIYMTLCSSSPHIIRWVKNIFDEDFSAGTCSVLGRESEIGYHNEDHFYRFTVSGLRAAIIIDYLRQFPVFKLDRKWNNPEILLYIEQQKLKYLDRFKIPDFSTQNSNILPFPARIPENLVISA